MKRFAIAICLLSVFALMVPATAQAHWGRRGRVQVNVGGGFNRGFAQVNVGRRGFFGGRRAVQVNVGGGFGRQAVFFRQPALFAPRVFVGGGGYGIRQQVFVGGGFSQPVIAVQGGGCWW